MEARPAKSRMLGRRCVVIRLAELTMEKFRELSVSGAGAVVVLLPTDLSDVSQEMIQSWMELEQGLLEEPINIPVYFIYEDSNARKVYNDISVATTSDEASSAAAALFDIFSTQGYQIVTAGSESKPIKDVVIPNIQGKLVGYGVEEQLPTIAIIAHYDTYGIAPDLATGADSNGSGVAALMEMARIFSRLYSNSKTHAQYNILFLLSGGGKFNYLGSKKWIDDQLEQNGLLVDAEYVLCLDSISHMPELHIHVSKPPKEGSSAHLLIKAIQEVAASQNPHVNFTVVHKKINLADDQLAWEHEAFSLKRIVAGTVSGWDDPDMMERGSIFDQSSTVIMKNLVQNVEILTEGLARHMFRVNKESTDTASLIAGEWSVSSDHLRAWIEQLSSLPRATQLVGKSHPLLTTLKQGLIHYLWDVKQFHTKLNKQDPEVVFYDVTSTTLYAYSIKPALFDLFLTAGIAAYLFAIFGVVQYFNVLVELLTQIAPKSKTA
jgi:hypothetical protein